MKERIIWKKNGIGNLIAERRRRHSVNKKQVVRITSPQWWTNILAPSNKVRAVSTKCLFFLFIIPFYWGAWGQIDWCERPCEHKNTEKLEKYSLALSLLKILINWPNWFLILFKMDVKINKNLDKQLLPCCQYPPNVALSTSYNIKL